MADNKPTKPTNPPPPKNPNPPKQFEVLKESNLQGHRNLHPPPPPPPSPKKD